MNTEHATTWLSAHIYYNEPWEHFFYASLLPFVDTAVKTGIVSQYFFERYWERGPHLRLRMLGETSSVKSILRPNLEEHFSNFMERYPSVRVDPNYPENFPEHYKWHPNNKILYLSYLTEQERFGGSYGLSICEEQFFYSSQAVLQVLKNNKLDWTYDDAMGNAIQLHLTFAHAVGLSLEDTMNFFHFYYKNWLKKPAQLAQQYDNRHEYEQETLETEQTFERAFEFQDSILRKHLAQLWAALENDYEQLSKPLQQWHFDNQVIGKKLHQAQIQRQLKARPASFGYPISGQTPEKQLLWSLFADFIHLTNNRLGIVHRDESFIAFIIVKSLETIQKEKGISPQRLRMME